MADKEDKTKLVDPDAESGSKSYGTDQNKPGKSGNIQVRLPDPTSDPSQDPNADPNAVCINRKGSCMCTH